jgi:hypothetical protein
VLLLISYVEKLVIAYSVETCPKRAEEIVN